MHRLTLSFDNGPFTDVTPGVLDVLARYDIRAHFFVCGNDVRAAERRAIAARAKAEGHRIGNHTLTHTIELGTRDDPEIARREIGEAATVLGELGSEERLFRPYGGGGVLGRRLLSPAAVRYLCEGGYTCVLWNCLPRDWEDPDGWPERAMADLLDRDWSLIVLHDVPTGAMAALPRFLDLVLDAGVEIASELPPEVVPIRGGRVVGSLDGLVGPAGAGMMKVAGDGASEPHSGTWKLH